MKRLNFLCVFLLAVMIFTGAVFAEEKVIRLGMIGLDTSHVIAFTRILNDESNSNHIPGAKVVAGFKGGSPDIPSSANRVDNYTKQLQEEFGVTIYDTIPEMLKHVDGVLIAVSYTHLTLPTKRIV